MSSSKNNPDWIHSLNNVKFIHRIRITVFGAAGVGKSSIIKRFLHKQLPTSYKRTFDEMFVVEYSLRTGGLLIFEILDTANSYDCHTTRAQSISETDVFLLVYSAYKEDSWTFIDELHDQIVALRGRYVPMVLIGNSSYPEIQSRRAMNTSLFWKCDYIECDANKNINIMNIFEKALTQLGFQFNLYAAVCGRRNFVELNSNARGNESGEDNKIDSSSESNTSRDDFENSDDTIESNSIDESVSMSTLLVMIIIIFLILIIVPHNPFAR